MNLPSHVSAAHPLHHAPASLLGLRGPRPPPAAPLPGLGPPQPQGVGTQELKSKASKHKPRRPRAPAANATAPHEPAGPAPLPYSFRLSHNSLRTLPRSCAPARAFPRRPRLAQSKRSVLPRPALPRRRARTGQPLTRRVLLHAPPCACGLVHRTPMRCRTPMRSPAARGTRGARRRARSVAPSKAATAAPAPPTQTSERAPLARSRHFSKAAAGRAVPLLHTSPHPPPPGAAGPLRTATPTAHPPGTSQSRLPSAAAAPNPVLTCCA